MTDKKHYKKKSPDPYPKEWLISEQEKQEFKDADNAVMDMIADVLKSSDKEN
ncbi:MAG: hypothetical protein ACTHOO_05875 [Alcanivorax sp.]|jgi:hypothetical protein